MVSKNSLLKELGWSDELINHFLIDDSEYTENSISEFSATVYDTNTFVINASQNLSRNAVIIMGKRTKDDIS